MKNQIKNLEAAGRLTTAIVMLVLILAVSGCGTLDRYERTYQATYDADTKSGAISMTLRPVVPPGSPQSPDPVLAMNDDVIAKIIALVSAEAKKNEGKAPPISLTQELPVFSEK